MSERSFTAEQRSAIEAHGGTILVSAAAGSGKTTVLVERIMRMLTDEERPVDADRLLVCTFTRASTAEMKSRLSRALADRLREHPDDRRLRRQKLLLQKSHITTIHSFCLSCLREYFSTAGVAPDFHIGDDSELTLLRNEILSDLTDECCEQPDDATVTLLELLSDERGSSRLGRVITQLDDFLSAFPDPDEKLAELAAMYAADGSDREPGGTVWGAFLMRYASDCLRYLLRLNGRMTDDALRVPALCDTYASDFEKDRALLERLLSVAENGSWDDFRNNLRAAKFANLSRVSCTDDAKKRLQADRDVIKEQIQKKLPAIFSVGSKEFGEDIIRISPVIEKLCGLVGEYRRRFSEAKTERKLADCNDLEHMTAALLTERRDGVYCRTQTAKELAVRFDEILIDEYQDTNYTQDLIFRAVSREDGDVIGDGTNMFMVGDVKQSIYGFRKAVPGLFLSRLERYAEYDPVCPVFPAKIILDRNFRSRAEVTDTVNFVFSQLMTPSRGGIDYTDGQQLLCAGSFPPAEGMETELHLLTLPKRGDEDEDSEERTEAETRDELEASYCAKLINDMISSGFKVSGYNDAHERVMRPATYSDFCIMRRAISGSHGEAFSRKLAEAGVPAHIGSDSGFFRAPEIMVILSLLRAINNPLLDIPLAAALRSPIFGFDCDRLAQIRSIDKNASLYSCIRRRALDGDEVCAEALDRLSRMRDAAATMPADRLIMRIYRSTGYLSAVQVTEGGRARRENLLRLLGCARSYEQFGCKGLSRFIRTLDRMIAAGEDMPAAVEQAAADCVTVRTMHGAKGLEFPICIVTGLGSDQNAEAKRGSVITSSALGLGMCGFEPEKRLRYSNIQRDAVALSQFGEETDEELRVLYVTMTRASEKLILLSTVRAGTSLDSRLNSAARLVFADGIDPFALGLSPSPEKWLLACAMRHPESSMLREKAGLSDGCILPENVPLRVVIPSAKAQNAQGKIKKAPPKGADNDKLSAIPEKLERIRSRLDWTYPYDGLRYVPAKVTASGATSAFVSRPSAARPQFIAAEKLSPAERGTALHKLLEHCDLTAIRTDAHSERDRLTACGRLTAREAESIDLAAVTQFAQLIADDVDRAETVLREWRFTVDLEERFLPWFTEHDPMGEQVILQGECDLLLITGRSAVIIDYKTDRAANASELVREYTPQLALYASAVRQSFDVDDISCRIYSFALGKLLSVDTSA